MNTKVNLQTILIVFMVCVTVIVSTNSYANAQMGGETSLLQNAPEGEIMIDPVPGGPGFIMVTSFQFKPYLPNNTNWAYSGPALYSTSTNDAYFHAGVQLPDAARITHVTLYYYDNSSADMQLLLTTAEGKYWGVAIATVYSVGVENEYRTNYTRPSTPPMVDNQIYGYYLTLKMPGNNGGNLQFTNVRIDYEYTVYTPTIMK